MHRSDPIGTSPLQYADDFARLYQGKKNLFEACESHLHPIGCLPDIFGDAPDTVRSSESSSNSLANFDLGKFLQMTADRVERPFLAGAQAVMRRFHGQLKGRASVSLEELIEFYLQAESESSPTSDWTRALEDRLYPGSFTLVA